MNLIRISNLFKLLVDASPTLRSYHFGYAEDIERNVPNTYDVNNDTGKIYPHVQWVAPVEGELSDRNVDKVSVSLRFYALQDYDNAGEPVAATLGVQTEALKRSAVEFWMALRLKSTGGTHRAKGMSVGPTCKYFTDHYATSQRLICVGMDFDVLCDFDCDDYQAANSLPIYANLPAEIGQTIEMEYAI